MIRIKSFNWKKTVWLFSWKPCRLLCICFRIFYHFSNQSCTWYIFCLVYFSLFFSFFKPYHNWYAYCLIKKKKEKRNLVCTHISLFQLYFSLCNLTPHVPGPIALRCENLIFYQFPWHNRSKLCVSVFLNFKIHLKINLNCWTVFYTFLQPLNEPLELFRTHFRPLTDDPWTY